MAEVLPPFSCTYSPNLPELLHVLNCSLAISTYQAGKVIFISAPDKEKLIQLPRNFDKPMGIAIKGSHLAVASRYEVSIFSNAEKMAPQYPKQRNTYDALFLPRGIFFTGETDIHDLFWDDKKLWAVNTRFSCLSLLDHDYSFRPVWKPFFIDTLAPDDRCHLNGVAFQNNKPKFVTALGKSNNSQGWKEKKIHGGILMNVDSNTIVADNLSMPHSPRIYPEGLFILLSGTGELARLKSNGDLEILKSLNGFARGMDRVGDFLFIGLSKLRETSSSFQDLPVANRSVFCGIVVIRISSLEIVAHLRYENSVEEIYDVRIIEGVNRPGILTAEKGGHTLAITTPEADFWAISENEKSE